MSDLCGPGPDGIPSFVGPCTQPLDHDGAHRDDDGTRWSGTNVHCPGCGTPAPSIRKPLDLCPPCDLALTDGAIAELREKLTAAEQRAEQAEGERDELRANLDRAREAKRHLHAALAGVASHLITPYANAPRQTPWSRFVTPAMRALDAALDQPAKEGE